VSEEGGGGGGGVHGDITPILRNRREKIRKGHKK